MKDAFGAAQTVLLLGGTSEVGLAIVRALPLQPRAQVVLAGRSAPDQLPTIGDAEVRWRDWDSAGDPALARRLLEDFDSDLDIVVAAAGVLGDQRAAEADPVLAASLVTTNLTGLVAALVPVAARMRSQRHGLIVVLSSVAGLRPRAANFIYGATKAGLDAFAVGLGDSLAGEGVRVLVVRPGFVRGRMTAGLRPAPFATDPDAVARAVSAAVVRDREVVYAPRVLGPVFLALRVLPRPLFRRLPG
ncbi:MAG: SDR family NAD(P)-dependent oxidoreductase [Mycobacteriales bacterium]